MEFGLGKQLDDPQQRKMTFDGNIWLTFGNIFELRQHFLVGNVADFLFFKSRAKTLGLGRTYSVFGVASQALLCILSNGLVQHTCECWTRPSSDETDASNSHDLRWWFKLALASDLTYSSQVSNNTHEKEWIFHVNGNFKITIWKLINVWQWPT